MNKAPYQNTQASRTASRAHKAQTASVLLSRNPAKAASEMTEIIMDMQKIYEHETEALMEADTRRFNELQEKKLIAARRYQEGISQMIARKNEMQGIDPAIKNKLKDLQKDFADISQKNMEALGRMKRCTERLGNIIRTAAKDAAKKDRGVTYGETGKMSGSTVKRAVSMGVSETA